MLWISSVPLGRHFLEEKPMFSYIPVGDKQDEYPYPLIKHFYVQMCNSKGITTNILLIGNIFLPLSRYVQAPFLQKPSIEKEHV